MAEIIRMPLLSDTMTEGVIATWLKNVGDTVKNGDILAEVETDKATMELENYADGTLLYVAAAKGEAVAVNGILAIVGQAGENFQALLGGDATPQVAVSEPVAPVAVAPVAPPQTAVVDLANIKATAVRMPLLSDTMTEGVIAAWLKKVGETVKNGDILAEVETDKATMELENYDDGVLLYLGAEAGKAAKVNSIIAIIGESGANFQAILDAENGTPSVPTLATPAQAQAANVPAATTITDSDNRVKASPLAKALAKEKGINLSELTGSGENGRIIKADVDAAQTAPKAAPVAVAPVAVPTPPAPAGDYVDTPLTSMRKTIARRLSESLFTAPHFYLTMEITMDKAIELRGKVNEVAPVKVSFNDFVLKAAALSLKQHPAINSSWLGDKIRKYHYINIGVAVAVDEGLLVPVIRNADQKTLSSISGEVKDLAGKAKDKKLQPKDWEGSTFSISNLGMFGIDEFTAIINPPDACILAVGGIKQSVGVAKDGSFFATSIMKVTLSCDHRVVDGASGAAFLQTLKNYLENPMLLLV